jgi:hypothetical protein
MSSFADFMADRTREPLVDRSERLNPAYTVDSGRIPETLRRWMRTSDLAPEDLPAASAVLRDVLRRAAEVLQEIEDGRFDIVDRVANLTGLCKSEVPNLVTGQKGIIVRRSFSLDRGRYSRPLAEVLTGGRNREQAEKVFDWLQHGAARRRLEIYVHDDRGAAAPDLAAYAIYRKNDTDQRFWYLARLLIAPSEIAQWTDPFVEAPGGRPN